MAASETLNTGKEKLDNWLQEKNFFTDVLEKVESKTGVKRIYIFLGKNLVVGVFLCRGFSACEIHMLLPSLGLVAVFALYLVFGYGADLIVTALGFAYPAYQS